MPDRWSMFVFGLTLALLALLSALHQCSFS